MTSGSRPFPAGPGTGFGGNAAMDGHEMVTSGTFEWAVVAAISISAHLAERNYALRLLDPRGEPAFLRSPSAPEPADRGVPGHRRAAVHRREPGRHPALRSAPRPSRPQGGRPRSPVHTGPVAGTPPARRTIMPVDRIPVPCLLMTCHGQTVGAPDAGPHYCGAGQVVAGGSHRPGPGGGLWGECLRHHRRGEAVGFPRRTWRRSGGAAGGRWRCPRRFRCLPPGATSTRAEQRRTRLRRTSGAARGWHGDTRPGKHTSAAAQPSSVPVPASSPARTRVGAYPWVMAGAVALSVCRRRPLAQRCPAGLGLVPARADHGFGGLPDHGRRSGPCGRTPSLVTAGGFASLIAILTLTFFRGSGIAGLIPSGRHHDGAGQVHPQGQRDSLAESAPVAPNAGIVMVDLRRPGPDSHPHRRSGSCRWACRPPPGWGCWPSWSCRPW